MLLELSKSLPALVEAKFNAAKANSSILFSPTEVTTIRTSSGIPFQLRYCPSLAKKPTASNPAQKTGGAPQKRDPFENPPPELLITELPSGATDAANAKGNTHILVLNKFPIIPLHFILATKANKPQTHALEQDDLEVAYACLKAWEEEGSSSSSRRLFAFFNSGEHSGASQPHRHLQFLPVESVRADETAPGWDLLLDSILDKGEPVEGVPPPPENALELIHHPSLPFTHFAHRFPSSSSSPHPTGPYLLQTYTTLLKTAQIAVHAFTTSHPTSLTLHDTSNGSLPISYNLALTTAGMAILPRRAEGQTLLHDDGSEAGFVALNGTALGGTLMVKGQAEWDVLRRRPERLDGILEAIGIPRGLGEEGGESEKPRI